MTFAEAAHVEQGRACEFRFDVGVARRAHLRAKAEQAGVAVVFDVTGRATDRVDFLQGNFHRGVPTHRGMAGGALLVAHPRESRRMTGGAIVLEM